MKPCLLIAIIPFLAACGAGAEDPQSLFSQTAEPAGGSGGVEPQPEVGGSAGQTGQGGSGHAGGGTGGSAPGPACAADANSFEQFRLDLESDLKAKGVVGAAVSVVCGGDTVFTAGIGQVSKGGEAVGAHTRFQLASLTKTMTAALAMRLAEQGKVSVDDSVSKWVPYLNTSAPYGTSFTFGQLLSHSSGYPAFVDTAEYDNLEASFQHNAQLKLWSPPGVVFNYSNDGYALAGLVLQKAGGAPFGSLVESEVFERAGMVDARMDAAKVQSEGDYAVGYSTWDNQAYKPTDGYLADPYYGPMGGAWASAEDLAHFAQAMMKGGGTLMSAESVEKMTTGHTPTTWGGRMYGYGMIVDALGDTSMWSHSGSVGGFLCELSMVPSRGFALAIMVNTDGYFPSVIDEAVQRFTGKSLPYGSYDDSFQDADMPQHVGTYQSVTLGKVVVSKSGGGIKIAMGGQTKAMTPEYRDTYTFPYDQYGDLEVSFWRVNGAVKYIVSGAGVGERTQP
jgi:CubicO group peptidase (beta-lactamase class C family)